MDNCVFALSSTMHCTQNNLKIPQFIWLTTAFTSTFVDDLAYPDTPHLAPFEHTHTNVRTHKHTDKQRVV